MESADVELPFSEVHAAANLSSTSPVSLTGTKRVREDDHLEDEQSVKEVKETTSGPSIGIKRGRSSTTSTSRSSSSEEEDRKIDDDGDTVMHMSHPHVLQNLKKRSSQRRGTCLASRPRDGVMVNSVVLLTIPSMMWPRSFRSRGHVSEHEHEGFVADGVLTTVSCLHP